MTVIRIERLRGRDVRVLPLLTEYLQWVADQFAALGAPIGDPSTLVTKHHSLFLAELPLLTGQRGRLLAAHQGDRIVGVGALKPISPALAEVKRMCVRPALRGQGVGRAILARLLADAAESGYRAVRLETGAFMTAARSLCRSMGFREGQPFAGSETAKSALAHLTVFMYLDQLPAPTIASGPGTRS